MGRALAYTPQARDAARVLGLQVAQARRERRWTAEHLAERAGISAVTLRKVERGDPTVALGTAFEVATLVGIRLFGAEPSELRHVAASERGRLALLPRRVRIPQREPDDDF
ncbi:helix-turn-helix domain-containing protein [soil metagenome]